MNKITIKPGMLIPKGFPYEGFKVTSVSKNGWCQGYYPQNVTSGCSLKEATTSVRAHWLVGKHPFRLETV